MSGIYRLLPALKDCIWGGFGLHGKFNKGTGKLAESWELSTHREGQSTVEQTGAPLRDFLSFDLPVMVKFIDACRDLSVQVHPTEEYARAHENDGGKDEMWIVISASKGAFVYAGFNRGVTKEELKNLIADGSVTEALNKIRVREGDALMIPAGTVHAIGGGCMVCEIQMASDLTYRLFDYNRVGADGKMRRLDIDKALAVADLREKQPAFYMRKITKNPVWDSGKFAVKVFDGDFQAGCKLCAVTFLRGRGEVADGNKKIPVSAGETYLALDTELEVCGNLQTLKINIFK